MKPISFIVSVAALVSLPAFADQPGYDQPQPRQRAQRPAAPQPQYDPQYAPEYDSGNPCDPCSAGGAPPPAAYQPQRQYYSNCGCNDAPVLNPPIYLEPVPPPPPPVVYYDTRPAYPVYPAPPVVPYYGPRPGYVPRPAWGGGRPGIYGPRPRPFVGYRRMALQPGCEVVQGNSGEFVVLSSNDEVLFSDKTSHAAENAEKMRRYYANGSLGLCGEQTSPKVDQGTEI